jgi:hypothetical protein
MSLSQLSMDESDNTQGLCLLDLCNENNICIINGTQLECSSPGAFTSFQPNGSSVIDFVIASCSLLKFIKSLAVDSRNGLDWFDHAVLQLQVDQNILSECTNADGVDLPLMHLVHLTKTPTVLNSLLVTVLAMKETSDESIAKLYRPVFYNSDPVFVYTDGSCVAP